MNKQIFLVMLWLTVSVASASATAQVLTVDGQVQYRLPSESTWHGLSAGIELPAGTVIVSGISGVATVELGEARVSVTPLSRLEIASFVRQAQQDETELTLPYGRLQASVRRSGNRGTQFRIESPISTAAVRGTEFGYDGHSLSVFKGDVGFSNLVGQEHSVRAGQLSRTWGHDPIESVEATLTQRLNF